MADNNNGLWQKLGWEKRVTISQQGIAQEDSLLHTYVVLFIAVEAMLFATLIAKGWGDLWSIIIAVLGIGLAIIFMFILEKRGNAVDRWGEILSQLWGEAEREEFANHYKGCVKRREIRQKRCGKFWVFVGWRGKGKKRYGILRVLFGWEGHFERFKSTRRLLVFFVPLIVMILWILIMAVSFGS